jgi:hypothetical protein
MLTLYPVTLERFAVLINKALSEFLKRLQQRCFSDEVLYFSI